MIKTVLKKLLPQEIINYGYHLPLAFLSSYQQGHPSKNLHIIGVTGTDGKTTTTSLIHHILKTSTRSSALISTVNAEIGNNQLDTGLHVTSPNPSELHKLLRKIKSKKIKYVCLEATSHGLHQFRLYPIKPEIAVLTNISHEHLDYHKDLTSYMKAKFILFKNAKYAVLNKDDDSFEFFRDRLKKTALTSYSIDKPSQLRPSRVQFLKTKTKFRLGDFQYETPLIGRYNLYNTLAAIAVAMVLEIPPLDIQRALNSFPGVKGRFESIPNKHGLNVVVDFAHTPNALSNVLSAMKETKSPSSKLIAVFGSAGLRDRTKRPLMGKFAAALADEVVLTAEDPRTEKLPKIIADIKAGIPKSRHAHVHIIEDRAEAINYAVNKLAAKGDWVGIFGKGHEKSMCFGTKEIPWSDQEVVRRVLERKG